MVEQKRDRRRMMVSSCFCQRIVRSRDLSTRIGASFPADLARSRRELRKRYKLEAFELIFRLLLTSVELHME